MISTRLALVSVLALVLGACARSGPPLPGDSISSDGAVTLSPPRFTTSPGGGSAHEPIGAIESRLFPPELVMEHQAEIDLTPAQRDTINREVEKVQKDMLRLQWDMQSDKEKLVKELDGERVDEQKAAAAAARVMDGETKIKATHLAMLVHVKNALTGEQQSKLRALRDDVRCPACAPAPSTSSAPPAPPPTIATTPPRSSAPAPRPAPRPTAPRPSSGLDFR